MTIRIPIPSLVAAAAVAAALLLPPLAGAEGPVGQDEAVVRGEFPAAEAVSVRDVVLTDELARRIEALSRAKVKERLVTFYTAEQAGKPLGYLVIQSHVVRTKRETLSIAFEPDGRIRRIRVLAFLEPEEYRPSDRWLAQFQGKGSGDRLAIGQDVAPISGATLTARGVAEQSRFLLHALREAAGVKP